MFVGPIENQQLAEPLWQLGLCPFIFRAGLQAMYGSLRQVQCARRAAELLSYAQSPY